MSNLLDILLMNLFNQHGIDVIRVEHSLKSSSNGLLHEPVKHYVVYSRSEVFCVVCKLITSTPKQSGALEFRQPKSGMGRGT